MQNWSRTRIASWVRTWFLRMPEPRTKLSVRVSHTLSSCVCPSPSPSCAWKTDRMPRFMRINRCRDNATTIVHEGLERSGHVEVPVCHFAQAHSTYCEGQWQPAYLPSDAPRTLPHSHRYGSRAIHTYRSFWRLLRGRTCMTTRCTIRVISFSRTR